MSIFYPIQLFSDWLTYTILGIVPKTLLASAVSFFIFDTIKILILLTVIIFVVVIFMLTDLKVSRNMVLDYSLSWKLALSASFTYFGWKFLSGRRNYIFIGNLSFWFVYIFFKLAFSFMVGLFIGPFRVFQMIWEIVLLNKSEAGIHNRRTYQLLR